MLTAFIHCHVGIYTLPEFARHLCVVLLELMVGLVFNSAQHVLPGWWCDCCQVLMLIFLSDMVMISLSDTILTFIRHWADIHQTLSWHLSSIELIFLSGMVLTAIRYATDIHQTLSWHLSDTILIFIRHWYWYFYQTWCWHHYQTRYWHSSDIKLTFVKHDTDIYQDISADITIRHDVDCCQIRYWDSSDTILIFVRHDTDIHQTLVLIFLPDMVLTAIRYDTDIYQALSWYSSDISVDISTRHGADITIRHDTEIYQTLSWHLSSIELIFLSGMVLTAVKH